MSKILITGGAGFIGSAVINHLTRKNHDISVIDNLSFGNRNFIPTDDSHFFHYDILDRDRMFRIMHEIKPEILVHLAAVHFIPYCNEHPFESANINIQGTRNVLDAAAESGIKKVFFASTAAVYPIADEPLTEEHPTGPLDIYGLSKLTGEYLCRAFHSDTSIPVVICRFFNAFGPNETNPHLIPEIQKQVLNGNRNIKLGNLAPKRDFIHTFDMANAVETLLEKVNNGISVFNLGRGIEYSVSEIVDSFSKALGEKINIEVDPARVRKVERMHLLADVSKLKALGWAPGIGIDKGIKTLVDG